MKQHFFGKLATYSLGLTLFFVLNILFSVNIYAKRSSNYILIISSYNPETAKTARNISTFLDEYRSLGGKAPISIENMNCGTFYDSYSWKENMKRILDKYIINKLPPRLIIILGQEAWSSYISQENLVKHIPVMCGMVSRNAIILPTEKDDLTEWEPQSIDVFKDIIRSQVVLGYSYDYNVENNIKLVCKLYPKTKKIALVTDNTYGGVCLQAYVKKEMKKFPQLELILLDGRKSSIYSVVDSIRTLPSDAAVLLGTWRVDKNNGYFMNNATYMMMGANQKVPAFSLTSIGIGHWAIGGFIPEFRTLGKDMALQAYHILKDGTYIKKSIEFIPNQYCFDAKKLHELNIDKSRIPTNSSFVNEEMSFFELYKSQVLGLFFVFIALLIGLLVSLYYFLRMKKLKDELEISEVELRKAKNKAEESDRLKTAFLANMTHEIRTPLNAIVGFSNVLASGGCTQEEQQEYFQVIQANSDLLLRLINDILDISRLEVGKLKFFYEECNVDALCRGALSTVESTCKTSVKFILDLPPVSNLYIVTDIQRLQQVLINVLSNANKFTKEGSITLGFQLDEPNNRVLFSVTDTGVGIPKDKQDVIFDRFEKLNDYMQGTGLGLAISKTIINIIGGDIWVDSSYTKGARFVFSHPLGLKSQTILEE